MYKKSESFTVKVSKSAAKELLKNVPKKSVEQLAVEEEIVQESYKVVGTKRHLGDLYRLVERHKDVVGSKSKSQGTPVQAP